MEKKLLVLMSSYNGDKYIREQIESIIKQKTEMSIKIRIRDDGSTDQTIVCIKQLQKMYPNCIELIEGFNVGYNASFFELIWGANGFDYYAFCDQDDIWLEDKIQVACEWFEKFIPTGEPGLYSGTSLLVKEDKIPYGITREQKRDFTIYNTLVQNICPGHNQFFNDELLQLIKQCKSISNIYVYDSWVINTAMLYGKIVFNNTPYTLYRQHVANQLGAGKNCLGRLKNSMKHLSHNDGRKYRKQIEAFADENRKALIQIGAYDEVLKLLGATSFLKRIKYSLTMKFYRQSRIETIAFKLAFIIGKF